MKVYTGGTFDLLHPGHAQFLEWCAKLGDLTVALNHDDFVLEFKGRLPVQSYQDRSNMLRALKSVTAVVPNIGGANSQPTIERVRPDIIAIGSDWFSPDGKAANYLDQMNISWEWLHKKGIALTFIPRITAHSTTELRRQIVGMNTSERVAPEDFVDSLDHSVSPDPSVRVKGAAD